MDRALSGDAAPRLVVIACPPRSCSSVVCAMLGQHPDLYGFPELNLFLTETVGQLMDLEVGPAGCAAALPHAGSGVLRSVAQLEFGAQGAADMASARRLLESRRSWSTFALLDHLLRLIAPRIGIDKSPRTAMTPGGLDRCAAFDPAVRIIHLARDPVDTIKSMDRSLEPSEHSQSGRTVFGALLWCSVHQTIQDFTAKLPGHRSIFVQAEAVLRKPELECSRIVRWLDIASSDQAIEAVLQPERSPYAFKIPGLDGDNDSGFLSSPALRRGSDDLQAASRLSSHPTLPRHLLERTSCMATRLGYGSLVRDKAMPRA